MRAIRYAIERKTMEEALFVEKERAQVTLNSIGDAVISTDVAGSITFLNLTAQNMTGWPHEEAVGPPDGRCLPGPRCHEPQDHPGSDGDGGRA